MRCAATIGSTPAASPPGLALDSGVTRAIKAKMRDALYVDTDEWKEKIYARAANFTLKAYRGLTS